MLNSGTRKYPNMEPSIAQTSFMLQSSPRPKPQKQPKQKDIRRQTTQRQQTAKPPPAYPFL
jgi:hypothetical protein